MGRHKERDEPAKARHQLRGSGQIFGGPILTQRDERHHAEVRELSFGRLGGVVMVCVVHTRRGAKTRLISARKANRAERKLFDEYLQKAAS